MGPKGLREGIDHAQIHRSVENEPRVANTIGDRLVHTSIKSPRLIRKTEECEKDKSTRDQRPAEHLEAVSYDRDIPPDETCNLVDHGIVAVRVGPAFPRSDTESHIGYEDIRPQRNCPKNLGGRKGHQPEVQATTGTLGMRHHLLELTLALVKCADGYD
jgi:hypothetical protein